MAPQRDKLPNPLKYQISVSVDGRIIYWLYYVHAGSN